MDNYKLLHTSIAHGDMLCEDDGVEKVNVTDYKSIIESLMFLTNTKPNVAHVITCFLYMSEPFRIQMKIVKHILKYVKGTIDLGIHYFTKRWCLF